MSLTREDLNFVVPARAPRSATPARRRKVVSSRMEELRRIFQAGIAHQIGLAQDPAYTYPSHKFAEQDGRTVKLLTYQSPRPWWYEEDGIVYLRLNFGERTMLIPGKNPVIRVGRKDNLLAILEALHILVDDRKMDDIIEKMVVVSR